MKILRSLVFFGFFLLINPDLTWALLTPTTPCGPPTPEIPGSLAPFLAASALGGVMYWRAWKHRKDKNKEDDRK